MRLVKSLNIFYIYFDGFIVFTKEKFIYYVKELNFEKADRSDNQVNCLDLTLVIGNNNRLYTRLNDKRDVFNFHIVDFLFLLSKIPSGHSYVVCISQLIRYARCSMYDDDFGYRHKLLANILLSLVYKVNWLRNSFQKFYGQYPDLNANYQRSVTGMANDSFLL